MGDVKMEFFLIACAVMAAVIAGIHKMTDYLGFELKWRPLALCAVMAVAANFVTLFVSSYITLDYMALIVLVIIASAALMTYYNEYLLKRDLEWEPEETALEKMEAKLDSVTAENNWQTMLEALERADLPAAGAKGTAEPERSVPEALPLDIKPPDLTPAEFSPKPAVQSPPVTEPAVTMEAVYVMSPKADHERPPEAASRFEPKFEQSPEATFEFESVFEQSPETVPEYEPMLEQSSETVSRFEPIFEEQSSEAVSEFAPITEQPSEAVPEFEPVVEQSLEIVSEPEPMFKEPSETVSASEPVSEPEPEPVGQTDSAGDEPADLSALSTLDDFLDYAYGKKGEGNLAAAAAALAAAVEKFGDDSYAPFVAIELANVYKAQSDYQAAIRVYRDACRLPAVAGDEITLAQFKGSAEYLLKLVAVLENHGTPKLPFSEIPEEYFREII